MASPEPWPARGPCRFSPSRCRQGQTRPHWIGWALIDVASVLIGRGGVGHRHREETPWTTRTCRGDGHVVMGAETGVARPDPGSTRGLGPPRGWKRREEPPRPPDGWALPTAGPRPLTSGPRFLLLYAPQSAVAVRGLYRGCQPWLQGPALGERERSGRGRNSRCSSLLPCPMGRASFPSARGRRASKVRPIRSRSPATPHAGQRLCPRGADPASFRFPPDTPTPRPPQTRPPTPWVASELLPSISGRDEAAWGAHSAGGEVWGCQSRTGFFKECWGSCLAVALVRLSWVQGRPQDLGVWWHWRRVFAEVMKSKQGRTCGP